MRTYSSPVSPDFVPRSAISAACLFKLRNCSCLTLWYSGMKIGPRGAWTFLKGSVPSQAVKAGRAIDQRAAPSLDEFPKLSVSWIQFVGLNDPETRAGHRKRPGL
jgi:hypothetical protein